MAWAPDYVTLSEAKAYLRVDDTVDDTLISTAITAASRIVDRHTGRQFGLIGAATEERFYTARRDHCRRRWVIEIDDLMTNVGLVVTNDAGNAIDNFILQPTNAADKSEPWTRIVVKPESTTQPTALEDDVKILAKWGWTTVPTTIKQATLLQISRLFVRRGAPFGVAGSPEMGTELRLLAKVDPDVAVALGPYIRWWAVA